MPLTERDPLSAIASWPSAVPRFPRWLRYGGALAAVALAALLRLACTPVLGPTQLPFAFFFPAIVLAAWIGRVRPALVATVASGITATALFIQPAGSDALPLVDLAALLVFIAISLAIVAAIEAMHRANTRASAELGRRRQVDLALRETEDRFRTMADGLSLLVWVHGPDGRQLFVNRTFCEFFDVTLDEMTGGRWQMLLHPEDVDRYSQAFFECVEHRRPFHAEARVRNAKGEWRWMESWGRPRFSADGECLGFVGASADVTERVLARQEIEAARDAAVAAMRAKDELLATLSHELRTPLAPALMLVAEMEKSPLLSPGLRQDCATIRANIELEARLIDDLLDVARVARGKLHLILEPCDAHAALTQAAETVRAEVANQGIRLEWQLFARETWVSGDAVRLQQVFWNLLRNAVRFTPPGGRVTLRSVDRDGRWRLEVVDNGAGIGAEDLPRIFEPFVQAGPNPAARAGGLGLGLAISRAIVQEHGGTIHAESAGPGQGATFVVELPVTAQRRENAEVQPAAAAPGHTLRILVVEDHAASRQALVDLLRRRGHQVIGAGGVAEARRQAGSSPFDVVISDLGLPDGSGSELMRELRRDHAVPGIALSGYGMESDVRETLAAGFAAHLTKPVSLAKLEQVLAQVGCSRESSPR